MAEHISRHTASKMTTSQLEGQPGLFRTVPWRQQRSAEVIVIGGGLSGLQAAVELQQAGVTCLVLEYGSQLGGPISRSSDAIIDPSRHTRVWRLATDFGIELEAAQTDRNDLEDTATLPPKVRHYDPDFENTEILTCANS